MPKVLRIINRFNLGGPTYNAAYLTKFLSPEFDTLLIGGEKDRTEESSEFILRDMGVDYRIIPEMQRSINPFNDLSAYRTIKRVIEDFKPDIVHTHAAKAGALGRRAAFSCNVPVTVHTFHGHVFHSYFGKIKSAAYKMIERNLAKNTSAIVAISDTQKMELTQVHRIASVSKVHTIPLGFDLNRFNENKDEKRIAFRNKHKLTDEIAIGIIGRLVPVKNHTFFVEAIKHVRDRSEKKIKAFIVGDGEERSRIEAIVEEANLSDIVVFTSWEKEVEKVYPGLDIVCMTSYNEGTPVSLIEAQASGIPIVSTNVGGIENVVISGTTALLSGIDDKECFFTHLRSLVENDELRDSFSKYGWNHVKDKFHYSRLCSDMRNLYFRLLK